MAAEICGLEGEKTDLSVEVSFLKNRLKECQEENEALVHEVDDQKLRVAKATQARLSSAHHARMHDRLQKQSRKQQNRAMDDGMFGLLLPCMRQ